MKKCLGSVLSALVLVACGGGYIDGPGGDDGPEEQPDHALRCEDSLVGPPLLRRLTTSELRETIHQALPELGDVSAIASLGPDPVSESGFANDASALLVGAQTARELLATAETIASLATNELHFAQVLPCASAGAGTSCIASFLDRVGPKLFRRSLTAEERSRYIDLATSIEQGSDFATATKWTLVALLQSPNVVYRSEIGSKAGEERELEPWEIASALSYNYTGAPPDEELAGLVPGDALLDPEVRLAQARRLLQTDAGHKKVLEFFRGWSGYQRVVGTIKTDVPNFSEIRVGMVSETERFIENVVYNEGGGVHELLTANYTSLDSQLAEFYGYGAVAGEATVVERPSEWGVGLLAQGSMLAGYAHSNSSSPTMRGLMVYERLQCNQKLTAPANIPNIGAPEPGAKTTRQRYEDSHAASPACNFCHQFFDPMGFAFENFDGTGRYRSDEAGLAIDASGNIINADLEVLAEFDGITDLAHTLADTPRTTDCVSGLAATWSFGGAGGQTCMAEEARDALLTGEIGILEYLARLSVAPHFTTRTQ